MNEKKEYTSEKCVNCGQTKTYLLKIDRGTIDIVKAIASAVRAKGINVVHPRKEMEGNYLSSNQVGNLSRPRFHGLIAKIRGNAGNYCLTTKGAQFLRGESIPRYAIVSKAEGHQIGYWDSGADAMCTIQEFNGGKYWDGINYEIVAGRIVEDMPRKEEAKLF
jgi:hypothetical protein